MDAKDTNKFDILHELSQIENLLQDHFYPKDVTIEDLLKEREDEIDGDLEFYLDPSSNMVFETQLARLRRIPERIRLCREEIAKQQAKSIVSKWQLPPY